MFRAGNLKVYSRGEKVWEATETGKFQPGMFLVVWGMVRCVVDFGGGQEAEFYMGSGGAIGIMASVIGEYIPGNSSQTDPG